MIMPHAIMKSCVRMTAALLPLALASCDRPVAGTVAGGPEKPTPFVPSEWQPEDPELAHGRSIYHQTCHLCHEDGEESAPRLKRREVWASRAEKGQDVLIRHATEGFRGTEGEMPARGGEDSHSDADIAAAVKFMILASQRTPNQTTP